MIEKYVLSKTTSLTVKNNKITPKYTVVSLSQQTLAGRDKK